MLAFLKRITQKASIEETEKEKTFTNEVTRMEVIERFEETGINWFTPVNEIVRINIVNNLIWIKKEWGLSDELVLEPFKNETIYEHYVFIEQQWSTQPYFYGETSYPFEITKEGKLYVLSSRQMHNYTLAIIALQDNKIQHFYHEFYDFILDVMHSVHNPVSPAEKMGLSTLLYFFFRENKKNEENQ